MITAGNEGVSRARAAALMEDEMGKSIESHSISAGLDITPE
jgi:tryptophan synthase beta subunit